MNKHFAVWKKNPVRQSKGLVLSLCDRSGFWAEPWRDAGYEVRLVDLFYGEDVRFLLYEKTPVLGILAAPPCTEFAGSGARWWSSKGLTPLAHGLSLVDACLRIIFTRRPVWWCLENPVGRLVSFLGPPKLLFNPCEYAGWCWPVVDDYTKRTCLWGDFSVPPKRPVLPRKGSAIHLLSSGDFRRSLTPKSFAYAFFLANAGVRRRPLLVNRS